MKEFVGKVLVFFNSYDHVSIWWDGHESWLVHYEDGGEVNFKSGSAINIQQAMRVAEEWASKDICRAPELCRYRKTPFFILSSKH